MLFKTYLIEELIKDISMGPFGSDIKKEVYQSSGIPVLNGSNLFGFKLNEDSFGYVSEEKANQLFKCNAHRGDIVVTHRGTLGQIIYIPNDSKFERYVISQSQFRLTCDDTLVIPEYLVYYFHTKIGQNKLLSNASQVGVPALARATTTFRKIEISIPPIYYQKEVIKVLLSLDAKIETNNKLNEKLEEMAQAIFKSWFVDFEPFKNQPFHDTELGMIPEGWEVYMASDLYKINIGKTPPRKESKWFSLNHNDIKWISISDLGKSGIFILDSSEKLTKEAINKHNIIVVPKNTILLSFKLTIGRVAICNSEMTTNEAIARFYLNDESDMEYLFMYLKNYNFDLLGSTSSIATAVNSKIIKKMPILKPSSEVINEFHCKINPLFEMIRTNIEENACLASLRDTLLPRLMSGEIKI